MPRFTDDEPAITLLHVSDMQFGKHHRFADPDGGFDTLLRRLCDDLDVLAHDHGLVPDVVALTGDLAEWGMKRELEQAAVFGEGLLAHLRLEPDRLLVIPGNHDINRKLCEAYFARCDGEGEVPAPPYWPKWEPYCALLSRLYREVDRYRFTELEPWTLFEIPALKVVVAGLNSTIHESHREADHHGFVGEPQLRWFGDKLADHEREGWLRIGIVHHNAVRGAARDDENLHDADDLREILGDRLHVLLHGHTHRARVEMLGPSLPVLSTGSAAVKRDQRPGPSPDQAGETPNQYQVVRFTRDGLWCAAREYDHERKRWIGDTRGSKRGDRWWYSYDRRWTRAEATFSRPPRATYSGGLAARATVAGDDVEPDPTRSIGLGLEEDLLDDVIRWCLIRDDGSLARVTRVSHRGPWGDYAKVHDPERGTGLLGAYPGDLTAGVLERWVADVHDPFRGRGQPVSKLVVASSAIDPTLRRAAQARGVDIERLIDYQRVLDTVGYRERLGDRLANDREYPSGNYLEQRMTVWNPIHGSSERVDGAAEWLSARLLEREGAFVLVLGQAGIGKTFLLREVARRLARQQAITPILVELRDLERAHTVEELVAFQFARLGVPWHPRAFRRDLEDGRLALLFDGFDELALRVRSAAIPAHFERIYSAAVAHARIAVSSRTEHFLSSGQVADLMTPSSAGTTPLGGLLERVQRRHVLELHRFEREDVAVYLRRRLGPVSGEARLARLARVQDLVGLACNPRMLGFLVDIPDDNLAQAAGLSDSITSDALYRIVVDETWLAGEAERLKPSGAAPGPDLAALRDAATNLALQLWRDPGGGIQAVDVGSHAGGLLARMCDDDAEWAGHTARVRTLLTRDDRGRIAFIHQTVLEWLVACRLAAEIAGELPAAHLDAGRVNAFMIDLLRERLDDDILAHWAEARLASPTTGAAAENARDILKRLNREATAQAIHRDQDLRGQDLGGQSLRGALLDRADLTGARLVGRDLTGASLIGAQLAYADFTDACLHGADLTGANLAFARFHRADLGDARLTGARLTGASFLGAHAVPALDGGATGIALAASPPVETIYAQAMGGGWRVAIHPGGNVLVSGHDDGTLCLWDCVRGQLLRILAGHDGSVLSVAFSPDGQTIASAGADATVRLWNAGDGSERARLAGHGESASSVAFSPDGKTLASAGADAIVRLWNAEDGRERARMLGHDGRIWSVAFSPDGTTVASGGADATVRLWNVSEGCEHARLTGHEGRVLSVAFSPDGEAVASGGDDTTVRLWTVRNGRKLGKLMPHRAIVWSVAFSPDGMVIASGGADATVRLWNAQDGRERARLAGHEGIVWSVAFAPDGKTVASGSADATVRLWNAGDGSERTRLEGQGGRVSSVVFSPDGHTVASGGEDKTVLWNAADGSERVRLAGHRWRVRSVVFSPDGRTVASSSDASVWLWNAANGSERRLAGHDATVWSLAFSPDGKLVASGGADASVRLWNAEDGSERARLVGHRGSVLSVAFSPDGKTIASGGADATVRLWTVSNDSWRARLSGHRGSALSVAFSPDGRTIASGGADATVRLWNASDGREQARLSAHGGIVWSVTFSPDGKLVASGGADATVRLWSPSDRREPTRLCGHRGPVASVAFSPDGTLVASGGTDATVRLWDVVSGRCLAILCGTAGGTVAARPDGRYRVRGNVGGQFWHVIGLHRYDVGELDALVPGLRLADDELLYKRSEATSTAVR